MAEASLDSAEHRRHKIRTKSGQDDLRFRVAEPAVELDHLRTRFGQHQPDIQDPTIGRPLGGHPAGEWHNDLFHYLFLKIVGQPRCRRNGAHAAGVRSLVVVEGALVVLRASHEDGVWPVDQGEERGLRPGNPVFDQYGAAGIAEPAAEHLGGGVTGLVRIVGDDDALASGETVGLDHAGTACRLDRRVGGTNVPADGEPRLWDSEAGAGLPRESFRTFKPCRQCRWPEGDVPGIGQPVD